MKHFIDIHTILSTPEDMDDLHDDPEQASEKLNMVLHMVYDQLHEDINAEDAEKILSFVWEHWHQDKYLSDIEVDDLVDWVDHLVNNWDNEALNDIE
ncbi:hypothetical protein ACOI22_02970 [Glaciecola sp. 2405UD65-10]|uniref:hypothetical protein n=1 Tax=Glaciecola sp. 2405UD65-10 TaxID=3397244 RepID=UPI003B599754